MQSAIHNPKSAIFIVGPTAVGKSEIAVELAERHGAEILNADAFQLYAGLALLTAKPSANALQRVRHHLVGAFALSESMSVARYLEAARNVADEVRARGKGLVIVGGTGLYVGALLHGLSPGPVADPALREELATLPVEEALARLKCEDPIAFECVDRRNPRRVQRALESALLCAKTGPAETMPGLFESPATPPVGVFLQRERAELHQRIADRTDDMFRRGVLAEVAAVEPDAVGPTAAQMIGWRECRACLSGEISESEARARISTATRQYAKRQTTWFKREGAFDPQMLEAGAATKEIAARLIANKWPAITSS